MKIKIKDSYYFADPAKSARTYTDARCVILPVPYEATTTYKKGTKQGPAAILKASHNMESFDEELFFLQYYARGL